VKYSDRFPLPWIVLLVLLNIQLAAALLLSLVGVMYLWHEGLDSDGLGFIGVCVVALLYSMATVACVSNRRSLWRQSRIRQWVVVIASLFLLLAGGVGVIAFFNAVA
jgi:hypothetical protein